MAVPTKILAEPAIEISGFCYLSGWPCAAARATQTLSIAAGAAAGCRSQATGAMRRRRNVWLAAGAKPNGGACFVLGGSAASRQMPRSLPPRLRSPVAVVPHRHGAGGPGAAALVRLREEASNGVTMCELLIEVIQAVTLTRA